MLDIGFWEIALIFIVALLVLKPEHWPQIARKVGQWFGRARRTLEKVKDELLG